jgi:hypothetical protein
VVALLAGPPNSQSRKGGGHTWWVLVGLPSRRRHDRDSERGRETGRGERENARARARGERGKIKQVVKGRLALWTQGS